MNGSSHLTVYNEAGPPIPDETSDHLVHLQFFIDDAPPGVAVHKSPGDHCHADLIVKLASKGPIPALGVNVSIQIQSDLLGDPSEVFARYADWDYDRVESLVWRSRASGQYSVDVSLNKLSPSRIYTRQVCFRFKIPTSVEAEAIEAFAEYQIPQVESGVSDVREISIVKSIRNIAITNRKLLYSRYDGPRVSFLLQQLHAAAQGRPRYEAPDSVIYYIDEYVEGADAWDNSTNGSNALMSAIRDQANEWFNDATVTADLLGEEITTRRPVFLTILGGDEIVPHFRIPDPTGREGEFGSSSGFSTGYGPFDKIIDSGCFLSDDLYGNFEYSLEDADNAGRLTMAVGRITGSDPVEMLRVLKNGVLGANLSSGKAVTGNHLCDFRMPDPEPSAWRAMVDYGLDVRNDEEEPITVDSVSWTRTDLLDLLSQPFGVFLFGGPGSFDRLIPPDGDPILTSDVADWRQDGSGKNKSRPLFGMLAGRSGYAFGDANADCLVYSLHAKDAPVVIAPMALVHGDFAPDSMELGETLVNSIFERAFQGDEITVGEAMRQAKNMYPFGAETGAYEIKTILSYNLFGAPWTKIPSASKPGLCSVKDAAAPRKTTSRTSLLPGEYSQAGTVTIQPDQYSVDITGFYQQVNVDGFAQSMEVGFPTVPITDISFQLPADATITDVQVLYSSPTDLGELRLPAFNAGEYFPGGDAGGFTDSPKIGVYPAADYSMSVVSDDAYQTVTLTFSPLRYDTADGGATLYCEIGYEATYQTDLGLACVDFQTESGEILPGCSASFEASFANATSEAKTIEVQIEVGDAENTYAGFEVAPGETYSRGFELPLSLGTGQYAAILSIYEAGIKTGAASSFVNVSAGSLGPVCGPAEIKIGEPFEASIVYDNKMKEPAPIWEQVAVTSVEGIEIVTFAPFEKEVPAESSVTIPIVWNSTWVSVGEYIVSVTFKAGEDETEYGPENFFVKVLDKDPPTPAPDRPDIEVSANFSGILFPSEVMELYVSLFNYGPQKDVDVYLVLEAYGQFYNWDDLKPGFVPIPVTLAQGFDLSPTRVQALSLIGLKPFEITWHGAITEPGTAEILDISSFPLKMESY